VRPSRLCAALCVVALPFTAAAGQRKPPTLTIYSIDVEGGQSTLIVTPKGESLLIDTGFPGDGAFASKPGDPTVARDAQRILAAARDAGVKRIDYLLITHFHGDHDGGVTELAQLIPIRTFIDHAAPSPATETGVPGTMALYDAYLAVRRTGKHLEPTPGTRLPLRGVDAIVVASGGAVLTKALRGGGAAGDGCGGGAVAAQEPIENPRSTGIMLTFGAFRFLDVGDLSGPSLHALTCPTNLLGLASVYLVAHHGGADAGGPAIYSSVRPLVALINNGPAKGGAPETFATLATFPAIDTWQLHRPANPAVVNMPDARVANLDASTSAWIKITATADGAFMVTNGRTGESKSYHRQ
jgi:competence protein ComEC